MSYVSNACLVNGCISSCSFVNNFSCVVFAIVGCKDVIVVEVRTVLNLDSRN